MKKAALLLYDLNHPDSNLLQYSISLATNLNMSLSVMYCYPREVYRRSFEFDIPYDQGIFHLLEEEVSSVSVNHLTQITILPRMGSLVEHTIAMTKRFDLLLFKGQESIGTFYSSMNSKIGNLIKGSKCAILIIPPNIPYTSFELIFGIEKMALDRKIIPFWLSKLNINKNNIFWIALKQDSLFRAFLNRLFNKNTFSFPTTDPNGKIPSLITLALPVNKYLSKSGFQVFNHSKQIKSSFLLIKYIPRRN